MSRVLVTAPLGNVGREVVRACGNAGVAVRVAGRSTEVLQQHFGDLERARFDFLDRSTWAAALDGCDAVFLLRPPPLGDMDATLHPFIDAAYAAGVQHIVFLSVAGADEMKWVPHRKVELHLAATGQRWTVLRPGFFAQNLQDAYQRDIVDDARLYVPAGQGRIAFIDVRDIGDVAARVFQAPDRFRGAALTLTGPVAVTFVEVAAMLTTVLGRPITYVAATVLGYVWHLRKKHGLSWMQVVVQTILHVGLRRGDAEVVDVTAEQVLGRRPGTMLDYIQRTASRWQVDRTP